MSVYFVRKKSDLDAFKDSEYLVYHKTCIDIFAELIRVQINNLLVFAI